MSRIDQAKKCNLAKAKELQCKLGQAKQLMQLLLTSMVNALDCITPLKTIDECQKIESEKWDYEVDEVLRGMGKARFPNLREVRGVEEYIPAGEEVDDPDDEEAPLWEAPEVDESWVEVQTAAEDGRLSETANGGCEDWPSAKILKMM